MLEISLSFLLSRIFYQKFISALIAIYLLGGSIINKNAACFNYYHDIVRLGKHSISWRGHILLGRGANISDASQRKMDGNFQTLLWGGQRLFIFNIFNPWVKFRDTWKIFCANKVICKNYNDFLFLSPFWKYIYI